MIKDNLISDTLHKIGVEVLDATLKSFFDPF